MSVCKCLFGLALLMTATAAVKQPLSVQASPAIAFSPANLIIKTSVEPDPDNRAMEIVANSEEFYRSSVIAIEGDRAPKTTRVEYRGLPPGQYQVTVALIGAGGQQKARATTHINVLEPGSAK
jgi:predicted phage tail protein